MKNFINFLIYTQDNGLISNKNYSTPSTFLNYLDFFFNKNISKDKYSLIIYIRNFFYKTISLIYYPFAAILYIFNFRIVNVNSFSIGTYCEEMENVLIKNEFEKKKLFSLSPRTFCANNYLDSQIFSKKIFIIKNNFLSFLLVPLSFINFLTTNPYKSNFCKKIFFEKQFYYMKKYKLNGCFDHDIFHETIIKKKEIQDFLNFIDKEKNKNLILDKLDILDKKICVLHIRKGRNNILRNFELITFEKTIKYLTENNYVVLNFTDQPQEKEIYGYIEFDIRKNINKHLQIIAMINCDLFLGSQSGPGMLAKFLEIPSVITNAINFNNLYQNENFKIIFKKFFFNNKMLSLNEIFKKNLDCLWDINILKKLNITVEDNTEDEIFYATKELIDQKFLNKNTLKTYFSDKNISFNNMKYSVLRNTSINFINNNKFLV